MKQATYILTDENGIHARPAGILAKKAKEYASRITITKGGKTAEAQKLMAVMSLGVKKGQLLLKFDMDVIKAHNLSVVTPVVVTNTDDLKAVNPISSGSVTEKDVIIRFEV